MGHPDLLNFTLSDAHDTRAKSLEKSPNALRTISEAADLLDVPQHVLRFWETKFAQIKPLKRNGGRRYYRPADIDVLQQIKFLLYKQGYTIKGAKKAIDDLAISGAVVEDFSDVFPPANVNDNVVLPELTINNALTDQMPEPVAPFRADDSRADKLSALREELLSLRASLTPYM